MEWEFNSYYTLIAATLVLLIGKFLVQKVKFLRDFNIPEPVAGGARSGRAGGGAGVGAVLGAGRTPRLRAERGGGGLLPRHSGS
mgnify:CR=1 FL=1